MSDHTIYISSSDNPQFKQLKKLASSARERRKAGLTLLDGVHLLTALAEAGGQPEQLILREGADADPEVAACLAQFTGVKTLLLDAALFTAISPVETPVGIMAVLAPMPPLATESKCGVLLENIQDPGNLGSMLRTAAAAGADAVYLSKGCVEAWSPKVLRAGMGAHFALNIFEQQELAAVLRQYPNSVATSLHAEQSLYELDLRGPTAFVFGNEGAGLSEELIATSSSRVRIPMPGPTESLNVAAACAVCLFERVRQKQQEH